MDHPTLTALAERALAVSRGRAPGFGCDEHRVPVERYLDAAELELERDVLFRRTPLVLAHTAELAEPGACLARDVAGLPVLITRDADGVLHALLNACRHRGTRITAEPCSMKKALVCPYHGWSYKLDGRILHIPGAPAFPSLHAGDPGLVELPLVERAGLVWVLPTPDATPEAMIDFGAAVDASLGPITEELRSLGFDRLRVFRRATATRAANWKLLAEAFLEGYHIRHLHRDTIYPFFVDGAFAADRVGSHFRTATTRRTSADPTAPLRAQVTLTYSLFPNVVIIFHPDYVSLLHFFPLATDRLAWQHLMLVDHDPANEEERRHLERSFTLIEARVFGEEDLHIAEEMQIGLSSRAHSHVVFGDLEAPAGWFHQVLDERLGRPR